MKANLPNKQIASNMVPKGRPMQIKLLLLLTLCLAVVACGGKSKKTDFFEEEEPAKKPKIDNQTKLNRLWETDLGGKVREGDAVLSPAIAGSSIYAASPQGKVYRINQANGKRQWQAKLKRETITAGVSVGAGLVVLGTDSGRVYALNQDDGSIAWDTQLDSEVLAPPVIASDIVIARSGDGKVYGLSTFDGEKRWTISRELPRLTLRGESKPLVYQGIVFIGFSDGTLAAVEANNGRALWDFPISFPRGTNEIDRLSDIDTTPLLVGDTIYVSSYQEITHALNVAERRISWSADVSSYHSLNYDAAYLYITDRKGVIHRLNRSNGEKDWSQRGLRLHNVSAPTVFGRYAMVGDGDGGLFIIKKVGGAFVGRHKLGAKRIVGAPLVDSGNIYLLDSDGNLQALSITPAKSATKS